MIYVKRKRKSSNDLRDQRAELRAEQAEARIKGHLNKVDFLTLLSEELAALVTSFLTGVEASWARCASHTWERSLCASEIMDLGGVVSQLSDDPSQPSFLSQASLQAHVGLKQLQVQCRSFSEQNGMAYLAPIFAGKFASLHTLVISVPTGPHFRGFWDEYSRDENCILNLSPLCTLVNLQCLAILSSVFYPFSLRALGHLPHLQKLDLTECDQLDEYHFEAVATLLQLRELVLDGCQQMRARDVNVLTVLPHLRRLNLADCWGDRDSLPQLSNFASVTDLNISGNTVTRTHLNREIMRMPALKRLWVGGSFKGADWQLQEFYKSRPDIIWIFHTLSWPRLLFPS